MTTTTKMPRALLTADPTPLPCNCLGLKHARVAKIALCDAGTIRAERLHEALAFLPMVHLVHQCETPTPSHLRRFRLKRRGLYATSVA